jgi:hypothetical protein
MITIEELEDLIHNTLQEAFETQFEKSEESATGYLKNIQKLLNGTETIHNFYKKGYQSAITDIIDLYKKKVREKLEEKYNEIHKKTH